MDRITILLKSVRSWTQCRGRREWAMSKTEQVMGAEWMNRQEARKRCKAEEWQKQRQQGTSPEIEYQPLPRPQPTSEWGTICQGLVKARLLSPSTLLENTGGGGESTEVSQWLSKWECKQTQMCCWSHIVLSFLLLCHFLQFKSTNFVELLKRMLKNYSYCKPNHHKCDVVMTDPSVKRC